MLMNDELKGMCERNGCSFFKCSACPCFSLHGPRKKIISRSQDNQCSSRGPKLALSVQALYNDGTG
jgi:hypothetical protein